MKVKVHYFWYYTENGTVKRATQQLDSDSVKWKDHEKIVFRKMIGSDGKPLKQRLRGEHWNYNNTIPIKEYHIEIIE